ncbi:spore gernimation protein [Bacillus sp. LL01]|uniref:spore germination protein n=1 Tax=Bacillus sp. LL01 TaxID=1665556 RepID=UPI00064CEA2D|nr:spore germination protein [Bacillus sp. LL01]KMJ59632.1 spore gernimation protein [Bacillus sp. LL01]
MGRIKDFFMGPQQDKGSTEKELFTGTETEASEPIMKSLRENDEIIQNAFSLSIDFHYSTLVVGKREAIAYYFDTLITKDRLTEEIFEPLVSADGSDTLLESGNLEEFRKKFFASVPYKFAENYHQIFWKLLNGYAVIIIDGIEQALCINLGSIEKRPVSEPSTQTIIRGPKDSFTETMNTNISLIRRRIRNPNLCFEQYRVGQDTKTAVVVGYIKNITNEALVKEVKSRIEKVNVVGLFDSGNIEEFLTDKTLTPFPLTFNTERPDNIAANLIEGKVAVLVDGSPFALSVPTVFTDFFISTEDYYQPFFMASFIRLIRYVSFMLSLLLPSLYVAISTYHHELIPTSLLISVQAQREGVPFPAVIEILLMELTFEVLREAGVRMPRAVGQTVSIVGALVIGQAAVDAGLVSSVLIIIVALTAIASFVSPIYNFSIATRILRFVYILMAALIGLYGVLLLVVIMVIHLTTLRSFGVPYLAPVAPMMLEDQKDVFIRMPVWDNITRPSYLKPKHGKKTENKSDNSGPSQDKGNFS